MDAITVIIVGDGERPAAVRSLVASWARAGIVGCCLWVTPSDVFDSPDAPPRVNARVISEAVDEAVDLFAYLGRFRLNLVRLVVGHLVAEDSPTPGVKEAATIVESAVERALPRSLNKQRQGIGIRLHRTVVVVPGSGVTGIDSSVLEPTWEANLLISPEDRPDLDRTSVYVRPDLNYDGHAAAALCAIGGLLRGVHDGVADRISSDSTTNESEVRVARISIRTVVGEDVLDAVARRSLDTTLHGPAEAAVIVGWGSPASHSDLVVAQAANYLLSQPDWAPVPAPAVAPPQAERRDFWSAVKQTAGFNAKTFAAVISWLLSSGRAGFEKRATGVLVGDGAGVLVTLGPRVVDSPEEIAKNVLRDERDQIDQRIRLEATRAMAPQPTVWTHLRALAFGLVDGGPVDGITEPRQLNRRELLAPTDIISAPGDVWQRFDEGVLRADDPKRLREYATELDAWIAEVGAAAAAAEESLAAAQAAAKDDGSADQAEPKSRRERAKPSPEVARAAADLESVRRKAATLDEHRSQFRGWVTGHEHRLIWRIGDDVARRITELSARRAALEKELTGGSAPLADRLKSARKVLLGAWGLILAVWVVALLLIVRSGTELRESPYPWLVVRDAAIATAVAIMLLTIANHGFYRAMVRYEWDLRRLVQRLRAQTEAYLHAGHELARLETLYGALRDWSRILAEVLHRPWQSPSRTFGDLGDEIVEKLPAALAAARQTADGSDLPSQVVTDALRLLYPRGWASRAFERSYEQFEEVGGEESASGHRSADLDFGTSPIGPRTRLREFWEGGAARDYLSADASQALRAAVESGELELPIRLVTRLGRYSDGMAVPEPIYFGPTALESTDFVREVFSPSGLQSLKHYVKESHVWLPRSAAAIGDGTLAEVHACAGPTAVRIDLSQRVTTKELAVFDGLVSGISETVGEEEPERKLWQ